MTTRRHVLQLLAASAVLPAAGCSAQPDAIAAWRNPGADQTDERLKALAFAILAPNPHNRQPWLIELVGQDEFVFSPDLTRLLPDTDPFDRQITLGCGAFLELMDLAAKSRGLRADIQLWPEGEPQPRLDHRPIARVKLTKADVAKDPLFDAILQRRTNRKPYSAQAVTEADLDAISAAGNTPLQFTGCVGGELRDALRQLAWNAFEKESHTPHAHLETARLLRVGAAEIAKHRDGISVSGPMVEALHAMGLLNQRTLADPSNTFTKQGLDAWKPLALDAPAFLWLNSEDNTRTTQIAAGRAYARANLAATARGLSMHPWSQALQEYPEMAALHAEAEKLMSAPGDARVQMLVRVGYAEAIPPAPRRGLAEHLKA